MQHKNGDSKPESKMKLQEHNNDDTKTCPHYVSTIQYYTNTTYV
eukprot:CAMPEP_0170848502 /NCGR_PEP_ID=MMETSP0734-20130129/9417_1 /TAXON_ID=186038 /ORGANISM="Fragilariopsis kerguelensis, Strain L26-C5" /LENGTH=43 /DNA_ID= /DNA_START= /DNA_END= /DNA_ORIENTATION=